MFIFPTIFHTVYIPNYFSHSMTLWHLGDLVGHLRGTWENLGSCLEPLGELEPQRTLGALRLL